jgi:hypothetical protein
MSHFRLVDSRLVYFTLDCQVPLAELTGLVNTKLPTYYNDITSAILTHAETPTTTSYQRDRRRRATKGNPDTNVVITSAYLVHDELLD